MPIVGFLIRVWNDNRNSKLIVRYGFHVNNIFSPVLLAEKMSIHQWCPPPSPHYDTTTDHQAVLDSMCKRAETNSNLEVLLYVMAHPTECKLKPELYFTQTRIRDARRMYTSTQ